MQKEILNVSLFLFITPTDMPLEHYSHFISSKSTYSPSSLSNIFLCLRGLFTKSPELAALLSEFPLFCCLLFLFKPAIPNIENILAITENRIAGSNSNKTNKKKNMYIRPIYYLFTAKSRTTTTQRPQYAFSFKARRSIKPFQHVKKEVLKVEDTTILSPPEPDIQGAASAMRPK